MPERPLVLFAQPSISDKERKHGGTGNFIRPAYSRQIARISPKFAVLQHAIEQGNVRMTTSSNTVEPEYTLVFETIGDPNGFYSAINHLKRTYPNIEWVMELSDNCPNSDDFYMVDSNGNRDDSKNLSTKIFCILTSQEALSQIMSLWNNYKSNEHFQFERGLAGFKHLFDTLYDIHQWGIRERIEDTGLLDCWNEELQNEDCDSVRTQIELFYRSSSSKQAVAEKKVSDLIISIGGKIICKSIIPEIQYHAILAEIPRKYAQSITNKEEVELVVSEEIMFMKGAGQTVIVESSVPSDDSVKRSSPTRIINEPIIALFDGMPQENHPLLSDLLTVDDYDSLSTYYPVDERIHGTSMASLILRGQNMTSISEEIHKVYVRPIMKSRKDFHGRVEEFIPDDFLVVDKIHECVCRLFEHSAGSVAPSVRIINLSIGLLYREYYNLISPLARLLDWLSFKYRVLFIVSAGNHPDDFQLGMDFSSYMALDSEQKDSVIYKYISDNLRNLRLLSPAESMNALTVGAVFSDNNEGTPLSNMTTVCSNGIPSIYSSFGTGINRSIKPDILCDGGRSFIRSDVMNPSSAKWVHSNNKPGIQSAYPSAEREGIGTTNYSFGTSNSAALISNKAEECYNILNDVFISETGSNIPYNYAAVMIKAMLVHGASWSNLKSSCINALNLSGRQANNNLHKYLGYGVADVDKVKECTKNQITLIGYGDIKQDQAFEYSLPLPFQFHEQKYKRKLTITLAYFSPIHPSSIKYRENQVWFNLIDIKDIAGPRGEYDHNAVQRGTLQHEIFVSDSTKVWDENDTLKIKVNCRADASKTDREVLIPYALFVTFEMAPEYDIDVYQSVVEKIHMPNPIMPNAI